MAPEQTETTADGAVTAPEPQEPPENQQPASGPADGDTAAAQDETRERLRDLEAERDRLAAEKAQRERADAMAAVVDRYQYVTAEIVQALPEDLPADRLEAVAGAVNRAMHAALNPPGLGHGGLTPNDERSTATWDGLFRRARENRRSGQAVTVIGAQR